MRVSHLFFATLRDDPADVEMPSHRLLVRAGYVRQLGSGIYSLLPLGFRAAERVAVENISYAGDAEAAAA
jgi:prolyl-tRNA synthetase